MLSFRGVFYVSCLSLRVSPVYCKYHYRSDDRLALALLRSDFVFIAADMRGLRVVQPGIGMRWHRRDAATRGIGSLENAAHQVSVVIPKSSLYGSVCCACAQRPGSPRASSSRPR